MDKSKPFGLVLPKRAQNFRPKTSTVFASDSDDEPVPKKSKIPQAKPLSKTVLMENQGEDPSIYEYDSIYDDMKAQEVLTKIAPKCSAKPSRYIDSLLKAAGKRKKEHERRVEKKVQKEREKEGDEFKDKDAFVTSAYKKKMMEMEAEEERERRENELNEMMDVTKQKDLSGFYRHFLKQSVGEEKVPVFGERMEIKKEVLSDSDSEKISTSKNSPIKKLSDATINRNSVSNKNIDCDFVSNENVDKDFESDRNTDGDLEENSQDKDKISASKMQNSKFTKSSSRKHRSLKNYRKSKRHDTMSDGNIDFDSDGTSSGQDMKQDSTSRKGNSKNYSTSKSNRRARRHDSESETEENNLGLGELPFGQSGKIQNDDDQDSSESDLENSEITVKKNKDFISNKVVATNRELENEKPRINIFEKRTVGAVFAEAQIRYFQRMAARGN